MGMRSFASRPDEKGQSLTELALFIPILLLFLVGFVEIGVLINDYINAMDASRGGARYVSPMDPELTRCVPFGVAGTPQWITVDDCGCNSACFRAKAATVKSWGADTVYETCQGYTHTNFFYVAGCMAVLSLPKGALDPTPKSIWSTNDYPGDDVVVTTVPITGGGVPLLDGALTWSLYGNQPSSPPSYAIAVSNFDTMEFTYQASFVANLQRYANAPPTGVVVIEVYRAHPQFTKLFTAVNWLVGSRIVIPDPIPVHTYSVFPLGAIEPTRAQ